MKSITRAILITTLALVPTLSMATVTPLAYYHLGEADPGAIAGNPGNATTVDSIAANNLASGGGAQVYSADAAGAAPHTGSTLSMQFFGGPGDFYSGPAVTGLTTDVGIEAWVRSNTGIGDLSYHSLTYNGNSANSGFGLYQGPGGNYFALQGGQVLFGSTPVTAAWVHLALVKDSISGLSTFYVNGVANSFAGNPINAGAAVFQIGGRSDGAELFNGKVDDVRLFTFSPGYFNPNDLLFFQTVVPEPSTIMLLGLGLAGMFAVYRRNANQR